MNVLLTGLPMPPSSNHQYITRSGVRKKTGKFGTWTAPAKALEDFQKAMRQWRLENLALANQARASLVAKFKSEQRFLRVDRYFSFRKEQVMNLDGTASRIDCSNRIKAFDDSLFGDVLGLDDCWISGGGCFKVIGECESVTVCLALEEYGLMSEADVLGTGMCWSIPWAVYVQRAARPFHPSARVAPPPRVVLSE